ncbi:MAG TPA: TetR-like C-terminal domain-containing protein, partial [Thermomicrobiales bacterium]|nr:TetR-like C-terminal domain-containing protein [Thermomicrobiales bacterium]
HRFDPPAPNDPPVDQLKSLARQLAGTLTSPDWQRALPVLLDVARRVDEFAELHESMALDDGTLSRTIARLVEEGVLPRGTPVGEVLVQIVGPLTVGAIFSPASIDNDFADRLVERLVRGYASEPRDGSTS